MATTEIFNSVTQQSTELFSQKKRKNEDITKNSVTDKSDNESVLTNDILLKKIRKSVIDGVVKMSDDFDGNEAQSVISNLVALDLMNDFDGNVLNKMYSTILSRENPSPIPSISISPPLSSHSSSSTSSTSSSLISKGRAIESISPNQYDSNDNDDSAIEQHTDRLETSDTQYDSRNMKHVRTYSSVSTYELVRTLGASGARWSELRYSAVQCLSVCAVY